MFSRLLQVEFGHAAAGMRVSAAAALPMEDTLTRLHKAACILAAVFAVALGASGRSSSPAADPPADGPVYVLLWFDTEDYILPESDDAAKRIAEFLTQQGIQATFKVVGEKGRTLERRGRQDVIQALSRHEIGYHANTHSQHPTPAEYEAKLDWEMGSEEFTRRERPGFEDLRRIFGRAPTCCGQPGNSWAPQAFPALKGWGVKVYLDDGQHVGLDGKPFWYGGLLNIFNIKHGAELRPNDVNWSNLDLAKANFKATYTQLSESGGGFVSLYFHPCEFIHQHFWDLNFAKGANPTRDQWKVPPMKSAQQIEKDFDYFEELVKYMESFPGVRFITASQALGVLPDAAQGRAFSAAELREVAGQVSSDVSFEVHGDYALSASEVFALLNGFVASAIKKEQGTAAIVGGTPYGPDATAPELAAKIDVTWAQFSRTVLDVDSFLTTYRQIPGLVWLGSHAVPPESYLAALAGVALELLATRPPPDAVSVPPARLAAAKYVADDSEKLWQWPIFPEGFDAPQLMALAKAQAWTLKPAILRPTAAR